MTYATTTDLEEYFRTFHSEIIRRSDESLKEDAKYLEAYSLAHMNYRIIVSTIEGVGIEYRKDLNAVESEYSSKLLSDMLLKTTKKLTSYMAVCQGECEIEFTRSRFINGLPFRLYGKGNVITIRDSHFHLDGDETTVHYAQFYSDRDKSFWSEASAVRRASDIIVQALTDKNKALSKGLELEEYIANHKKKSVLLLGNYNKQGTNRLEAIQSILEREYNVLIVKDIADEPSHTLSQKVTLVGNLCRFVIVDDSDPSGHIQEIDMARNSEWITVLLHKDGRRSTFMNASFAISSRFIKEFNYTEEDLEGSLGQALEWAEAMFEEFKAGLKRIYPWRPPSDVQT